MAFSLSFSHVGLYVHDMHRMVAFYTRFMGFAVSDREPRGDGEICFLTRDPREHHQLVLASGRPASLDFNLINQLSFRVDSLATLRQFHRDALAMQLRDIHTVTHGTALSVYFLDPEGNRIEILIDTPWYCLQPQRIPVDFSLDDAALWKSVEALIRDKPKFKPREQWVTDIERDIAAAGAARGALPPN
jgi:catechol 2,3-dioxygenase-like lactoylglutathione lyase family enzyme